MPRRVEAAGHVVVRNDQMHVTAETLETSFEDAPGGAVAAGDAGTGDLGGGLAQGPARKSADSGRASRSTP